METGRFFYNAINRLGHGEKISLYWRIQRPGKPSFLSFMKIRCDYGQWRKEVPIVQVAKSQISDKKLLLLDKQGEGLTIWTSIMKIENEKVLGTFTSFYLFLLLFSAVVSSVQSLHLKFCKPSWPEK